MVRLFPLSNCPRRGQAIHDRHLPVHQDQVIVSGDELFVRDGAVFGDVDPVRRVLQVGYRDRTVIGGVLDQKNMQRPQRRMGTGAVRHGRAPGGPCADLEGYGKRKHATLADFAFDPDAPAHQFHQALGNRQPQSRAAVPASGRRVGLGESLKHGTQLLARNADAGVRDREPQCARDRGVSIRCDAQCHFAGLGELDRIAE